MLSEPSLSSINKLRQKIHLFNFLFFFLFCFVSEIFSAEIVLRSGDTYIAEITESNEKKIIMKWKGRLYEIPRSEILKIDNTKKGNELYFKYDTFDLFDGSQIKGVIVNQTEKEIVIKTEIGLLTIDRLKLINQNKPLPSKYDLNDSVRNQAFFGFGSSLGSINLPSNESTTYSGLSLFYEPAFLVINNNLRIGVKIDYLNTRIPNFQFLNNVVYLNYTLKKSELLIFYFNIGGGGSLIFSRNKEDSGTQTGFTPVGYVEIGWSGLKYENIEFRIGLSSLLFFEKENPHSLGITLSAGTRI
jgi:hypothetical protein